MTEKDGPLPESPDLAANLEKLREGRSVERLRKEMKEVGIDIGTGTLHRAITGKAGNRLESLTKIADFFKITVQQLLAPNLGMEQDGQFVDVPRKKVALSAGHGSHAHIEEDIGSLKFRADFLRSIGATPATAAVVDVVGLSMEPTIPHGAVVLINTANREKRDRLIYALRIDGELFVKRLISHGDQWLARSDNEDRDEYPDIPLSADDDVIGRAVWVGAKL